MKGNTLSTDQDVKEKKFIWEYFRINPKDNKKALCVACGESISCRGTTAKNFNTSNLRYHYSEFTLQSLKN